MFGNLTGEKGQTDTFPLRIPPSLSGQQQPHSHEIYVPHVEDSSMPLVTNRTSVTISFCGKKDAREDKLDCTFLLWLFQDRNLLSAGGTTAAESHSFKCGQNKLRFQSPQP